MSWHGVKGDHDWVQTFLKEFAKSCNVTESCKKAGVSRVYVYKLRMEDPEFAAQYEDAYQEARDSLQSEAFRRGRDGFEESVWYQGQEVGTVRRYSDSLLTLL